MPNSKTDHPLKVMFAGLFSLILAMGIARFSYTPLLPVMINETYLNDATGGWLATINYIGYMLGAIIAASISDLKLRLTLSWWFDYCGRFNSRYGNYRQLSILVDNAFHRGFKQCCLFIGRYWINS